MRPTDLSSAGLPRETPQRGPGATVRRATAALGLVLLAATATVACQPVQKCNGYTALCDRAFDAVAYPTTHNAMSNAAEGWAGPNQEYGITRQLNDGVRALMLDTHYNVGSLTAPDAPTDVPLLCHAYCQFGWKPLRDGLGEIKTFLDTHPNEVVSIIFETYVTPADTAAAFSQSGLSAYVTAHAANAPWPTLRQMIAAGTRLVAFTDSGGGSYPWYLDVWAEAFDNPYSAKVPADLVCTVNRGNGANRLFILNNFLTDPVARRPLADQVNYNPFLVTQAQTCQTARAHLPNFVTVDFYNRGNLFAAVKTLNGV